MKWNIEKKASKYIKANYDWNIYLKMNYVFSYTLEIAEKKEKNRIDS